MQFKRMAVVAAAAVAGQTFLMAAPAMAEEHPAVTVPDAVPVDTTGPSDGTQAPAKEKSQEPAQETAEKKAEQKPEQKPEQKARAEDSGAQQPAVQAVAAPAAPDAPAVPTAPEAGARTPAQAAQPEALADGEDSGSDRILMGPEVTVQGIPAAGFKADGSWTPLTVTVDNSGHLAVDEYTPVLGVSQAAGQFGPAHINVEYRTAGGPWTAAVPVQSTAPTLGYALGSAAAVPAGQIRTIDVRISFAADTPVVPFDLTADGRGRVGTATGSSPTSLYATRITGAPGGDEDPVRVGGPALTVSGVPESVRAGGDWTELSVRVDNAGRAELAAFDLGLVLARPDFISMQVSQITVEVLRPGAEGQPAAWQSVEIVTDEDGYFFAGGLVRGPIGAGAAFDVPVRVRFSADAPTGSVSFFAWGTSQVDAETPPPWADSRSPRRLTTLLEPTPAPGGGTPGGGTPGGETPGGGTPGGGTPGGETPGGGTPGSGTPGSGTPGSGTPGSGTPGGETPGGESPGGGTPGSGTPRGETPGGGTPGSGTPGSGTPGNGTQGSETPGSGTPGGNVPVPNGGTGAAPISTLPNSGSNTGTAVNASAPLAATGADPATSWALGGAGVALAMGAALVAGTGRRRRRTTP
ncbi:hypothetical protein OG594_25500 [Streptomyces sp. NBC_01214]|uniref:hypothetical protein n=1 Tax=Streptomyces sp. NBC_01214 TaxID=2903777 RepID=UPI00224D32A6|nr:hypothetical protein [Streptomyces sp. NBC_01214]MCX4804921.1 hypothetical protein [Streptomyces sp. NBC_01214]